MVSWVTLLLVALELEPVQRPLGHFLVRQHSHASLQSDEQFIQQIRPISNTRQTRPTWGLPWHLDASTWPGSIRLPALARTRHQAQPVSHSSAHLLPKSEGGKCQLTLVHPSHCLTTRGKQICYFTRPLLSCKLDFR